MRFSEKKKGINVTTNYEGEKAWKLSPKMELYTLVCTASLQKKFYTNADECITRLRKLIKKVPVEFVAQLAVYAREQMYLRSIPLVLVVELCKVCNNSQLIEDTSYRVIQRADELVEILAYYQQANNRTGTKKLNKLHNGLKKGIARAFGKFNEYSFAKYNRDTEVKLRDAMFLTHPKPDEDKVELFKKIADDKLETPDTWEVELSKNDGVSKKTKWERLIEEDKLGYMAQLRNLRNMLGSDVQNLGKVLNNLSDKEAVAKSRQLPFRFFSAFREITGVGNFKSTGVLDCLEEAIKASIENIPGFDYNTNVLIACDMSGSMQTPLSVKSSISYYEIGIVLGMLLQYKCKSVMTGIFGETWKIKNLPKGNILENTLGISNMIGEVGHSTNGYLAIKWLIENKQIADKVFVFTDCQLWDSQDYDLNGRWSDFTFADEWKKYKKIAPNAKLYMIDLAGYGNTPIDLSNKDVYMIAGWSDKIFQVLDSLEKGENSLYEIEKIKI